MEMTLQFICGLIFFVIGSEIVLIILMIIVFKWNRNVISIREESFTSEYAGKDFSGSSPTVLLEKDENKTIFLGKR